MSVADPLSEDDDLRAAELAFGLLDAEERRSAETRAANDPAFADACLHWQGHAVALLAGPSEAPRPSVWTRIEARLPANDVAPRSSLRWWQAGTLTASAAAIVLAFVAIDRSPIAPPPGIARTAPVASPQSAPPMLAVLTASEGKGVLAVSYDPQSRKLSAAPNGMVIGQHSAELWVIPADGKPRSLGVVADRTPGRTAAPAAAAAAMGPGVTLAISIEPIGGSPTGQPTGKVIMTGKIAAV
jgi:anti-sigma-K factor RskA